MTNAIPISLNSKGSPPGQRGACLSHHCCGPAESRFRVSQSFAAARARCESASRTAFLLESVEGGERVGRYTFFGVDPFQIVSCRGDRITVRRGEAVAAISDRRGGGQRPPLQEETGNVFEFLRRLGARYHSVEIPGLPPFTAGAVGYLSYEAVRMLERLPAARPRRRRFGRRGLHVFFERAGL